jgi:hypothetical protein
VVEVQAAPVKAAEAVPASAPWGGRITLTRAYLVFAAVTALGYVIILRMGPPAWVPEICYVGFGLSASLAILVGARLYRPRPALAWYLFAAGTFTVVVADLVFVVTEDSTPGARFPSLADALYLVSYLFMVYGLWFIIRRRGPGSHRASLIDALLVATAVGLLAWTLLVAPFARADGVSPLATLTSMAYPIVDLLLLTAAIKLAVDGGRRTPAVWLLGASLVCVFAADTAFSIMQLSPGYHAGTALDLARPRLDRLVRVLWGGGAAPQHGRAFGADRGPRRAAPQQGAAVAARGGVAGRSRTRRPPGNRRRHGGRAGVRVRVGGAVAAGARPRRRAGGAGGLAGGRA